MKVSPQRKIEAGKRFLRGSATVAPPPGAAQAGPCQGGLLEARRRNVFRIVSGLRAPVLKPEARGRASRPGPMHSRAERFQVLQELLGR